MTREPAPSIQQVTYEAPLTDVEEDDRPAIVFDVE